jgi:hypothetical protein
MAHNLNMLLLLKCVGKLSQRSFQVSQKHWTTTIKENEHGELYIDIPEEALNELGWNETTEVEFVPNGNGSFSVVEVKDGNSIRS